jgi:hypothetical protein
MFGDDESCSALFPEKNEHGGVRKRDGVMVDIQREVLDKVPVSAFTIGSRSD